jgi:hypothetical protein
MAIAGHLVAGSREARQALGVHLQQIAGAGPLKAPHRLTWSLGHPRHASSLQAAADRCVRQVELGRDQARTPTGPPACLANTIVHLVADAPRLAVRCRRAIRRPVTVPALLVGRPAIALDPVLNRRDAHPAKARRFAARHPPIKAKTDQLDALPARQPLTLVVHPG